MDRWVNAPSCAPSPTMCPATTIYFNLDGNPAGESLPPLSVGQSYYNYVPGHPICDLGYEFGASCSSGGVWSIPAIYPVCKQSSQG